MIYEIGYFVMKPMPYEDAETRSARAETRSITLEAFSIAVPLRNLELCPLYSEGRCGKNRQIYEIGHFVMKPMPYEDAETRSARAETRSITLEAFSIAVPLRNFELCPLYSEGRCGKNRKIYEIGHFSAARPRLGVVDTANCSKWTALYM